MKAVDFFEAVDKLLTDYVSSDPAAVAFFIGEIEELIDEWDGEEHEYKM